MAKEIKASIKMRLQGGAATPAPPVGSSLGQHQVNLMDFCKQFNAQTANRRGETVPVFVEVFTDKTFRIFLKTPPTTELIKKRANAQKGSARPQDQKVGKITWQDVDAIAKIKMPDLNAHTIEAARKIVAGSARSMGIDIID